MTDHDTARDEGQAPEAPETETTAQPGEAAEREAGPAVTAEPAEASTDVAEAPAEPGDAPLEHAEVVEPAEEAPAPAEAEPAAEAPAEAGEAPAEAAAPAEAPAEAESEGRGRGKPEGVKVRRKKSLYAQDVQAGQAVDGVFLVRRKQLPVDRAGRTFLALTLVDRTGRLEARLWDDVERVSEAFREGEHVRVRGQSVTYQGKVQVRIEQIERVDAARLGLPASEFLTESRSPVDRMLAEVTELVERIQQPHLKALVRSFLDDPEHLARFKRAPAAQNVHHAWLGGLLEHTLSTMKLGVALCDHYPQLNRDMVLAGCFLHDYGKIAELSYEGAIAYTDAGRLVGHLVLTSQWIHERAGRIEGFPEALLHQLVHTVVSHHGELAYGSPKRPKTLEAVAVHYLDVLDARISSFTELLDDVELGGWTDYNRIYDRPLYRGDVDGGTAAPARKKKRRKRKKGKGGEAAAPRAEAAPPAEPAEGGETPAPARERRPRREERRDDKRDEKRGERREREEGREPRERREGGRPKREGKPAGAKPAATLTFNPFAALAERQGEAGGQLEKPEQPEPAPQAEQTPPPRPPEGGEGGEDKGSES